MRYFFTLLIGCSGIEGLDPEGQFNSPRIAWDFPDKETQPIVVKKTERKFFIKKGKDPKKVNHWINYFRNKDKKRFLRHLQNGEKYRKIIQDVFESKGLPKDLYFVGLIESGYHTFAKSSASAMGPWQFMKGTAIHYGLRVNKFIDERKNIFKSTLAAANYLKDLHNIFSSWELALAAYNSGEYRVLRAIRKGNTRNFFELGEKKLLPKETRFYVPKVYAAMTLYYENFSKHVSESTTPKVSKVVLKKTLNVKKFLKLVNLDSKKFGSLNPDVLTNHLYASRKRPVSFYVPTEKYQTVRNILTKKVKKVLLYKVRAGESLSSIAEKFDVPLRSLKRLYKKKLRANQVIKITQEKLRI